jgi:hypothetical protein
MKAWSELRKLLIETQKQSEIEIGRETFSLYMCTANSNAGDYQGLDLHRRSGKFCP